MEPDQDERSPQVEVLLDQRLFVLEEEQFDRFVQVLDNPPPPSAALKELMLRRAPWDE